MDHSPDQTSLDVERVRSKAYQLWETRGCPFGTPETDWFQAEADLHAESGVSEEESGMVTIAKTIGSLLGSAAEIVSEIATGLSRA